MKTINNRQQILKPWALALAVLSGLFYAGSYSWAAVTLKLPKNIYILAANGKNLKSHNTADLPNGINQIVIQYQGEPGAKLSSDGDVEYSDTFVVKFTAENQELEMIIPWIRTVGNLEEWNKTPDIGIETSAGDGIDIQVSRLQKTGLQVFRNYAQELAAFNHTSAPASLDHSSSGAFSMNADVSGNQPAPLAETKPVPPTAAGAHKTAQQPAPQSNMVEDMLKYWYQQADEQTRQKFKTWIHCQ